MFQSTPDERAAGSGRPRPWPEIGFAAAAMTLVAASHTVHDVVEGAPIWRALAPVVPIVAQIVVLSLGYAWATRRGTRPGVAIAGALASCAVFGPLVILGHTGWRLAVLQTVVGGMFAGLGVLAVWGLVFLVPVVLRDARERTREARRTREEAELSRLRASLRPHFLLNTLNAIVGLIGDEPRQAKRLVVALGDLLRDSLDDGPDLRPFADDVAWLRRYAEILEVRHQGALTFEWDLAPETMDVLVPRLLLQPLLENAVKHGALASRGDVGRVAVRSAVGDAATTFVVADNGPGLRSDNREGLGLSIVRRRLERALPGATLKLAATATGAEATITIPRRIDGSTRAR